MMCESPVTIVIPVRDRATIVGRTLDSVAAQTARPLRVVLVDNGSSDSTLAVLEKWRTANLSDDFDIKVISEPRPGAAVARNAGLELVATEWTMYFDSDDVMAPGHVRQALDFVRIHPDADIVGWDVLMHLTGEKKVKKFTTADAYYNCVMHGTMGTQRYMCRTELLRKAGGWNNSLSTWDDIELGVRMLNLSPRIRKRSGVPTVDIYASADSITGSSFTSRLGHEIRAIEEIRRNLPDDKKMIADMKLAVLAGDCAHEGCCEAKQLLDARMMDLSPAHRHLLRAVYYYKSKGLRGVVTLARPFLYML